MTDLITRMAEAAYKRRMDGWLAAGWSVRPEHAWDNQSLGFRAEIRAEMEMLRDMVLTEAREHDPQGSVRRRRLSLF